MISEKDVFRLRELRVPPGAVLVVVLHAEHDVAARGVVERAADPLDGAGDAVGARELGIALAAERPAMARAHADGQVDRRLLPLHLAPPFIGVRMGEVGREADHRGDLSGLLHGADDRVDVGGIEPAEKSVVMLDAFTAEAGGIANPAVERHPAVRQFVEVALGEHADPRKHAGSPTSWEGRRPDTARDPSRRRLRARCRPRQNTPPPGRCPAATAAGRTAGWRPLRRATPALYPPHA